MENQALSKRRREEVAGSMEEDRISQLPQTILHHHIFSLLSQKDAVRTCILSKSWRHLGLTRPKFDFLESYFAGKKQEFLSVVKNTLQRYDHQKLPIQEFIFGIESNRSISLLNKWIPIVVMNMGVKIFNLSAFDFSLPSVVFQGEFLTELYLEGCNLNKINNCIVKLHVLKRLSLKFVNIEEKAFEKIMSSCPLIQYLVLDSCYSLNNIKVKKARNLKHFGCYDFRPIDLINIIEIDDDAKSLETIHISRCGNWHSNYFFPRLKSLCLWNVHLRTGLLNNLSSKNCPCLEGLELHKCSGFKEFFKLSNRSIKHLVIDAPDRPIKADIDAANMIYFEFRSIKLPTISFSTTPRRECESFIEVWRYSLPTAAVFTSWLIKLYQFLKALSQSRISLDISYFSLTNQEIKYEGGVRGCEPVVVEHLFLGEHLSSHELPLFLSHLFRTCRPRYIGLSLSIKSQEEKSQLAVSIWKTLVNKGETWRQDLKESSIQILQENGHEWGPVTPVQSCAFSNDRSIRFRLKWRGLR